MEIRVLVVDDETDFLETIVKRLAKKSLSSAGASSGEDALALMKTSVFDVILLDIKMPGGMDGLETLKEMKRLQPLAEVILLTGHGTVESSVQGMRLGAFDYILKPAKFEELCEKVAQAYMKKSEQDDKIRRANIQQLLRNPGKPADPE
ncbi:MAG: response regulator [Pseudomonadota bacterium]